MDGVRTTRHAHAGAGDGPVRDRTAEVRTARTRTAGVGTAEVRTAADGSWQLATGVPSRELGPGVLGYRGFRLNDQRPQRRIEFASGMITMVVTVEGQVRVGPLDSDTSGGASSYTSLVNGPRCEATMGEHHGRLEGVEIHLAPWMAYSVLGTDMTEMRGRMLPLSDVLGPLTAELGERLAQTPSWPERFAVLDAVLGRRRAAGRAAAPQMVGSWRELVRTDGLVPLRRLSEATGWSTRHVELRFRQQIGLPPKTAARVLRIQRVLRMLTAGVAPSAAAAACGFYDQAHLHRDFKAMTGCTPGEFRARREAAGRPVDRMPGRITSALLN